MLHLLDEFSKNISLKASSDYASNNIKDGLNTLTNVNYTYNEMLDINSFSCLYSPNDKTMNTSIFKKIQIPHPIGRFDFYNFK